jgi:hypothetical protein
LCAVVLIILRLVQRPVGFGAFELIVEIGVVRWCLFPFAIIGTAYSTSARTEVISLADI